MAGICGCTLRLLPKNIKNLTFSKTCRLSYKVNSRCIGSYSGGVLLCPHRSMIWSVTNSLLPTRRLPRCIPLCNIHTSKVLRDESRVITVPQLAESLSEGDIQWLKGVGDQVAVDDTICEIETDKTAVPVHSPVAGVIEELLVEDGSTVQPGKPVCKLRVTGDAPSAQLESVAAEPSPPPAKPDVTPPTPSPAAAEPIPTTPPPVPPQPQAPVSSIPTAAVKLTRVQTPPAPSATPGFAICGTRTEQRVKMSPMRLCTGQRLKEAQNTCVMISDEHEIDMSNVMEMRNAYKDAFLKKHNVKLGFMSAFVKASAYALQDQPIVNAVIDGTEIVYRDYIDISVAVATPKGLVVPVIRNVEQMNFADVEKAIRTLREKARLGALAIEDMDGGTFTISNPGVFGSLSGTPIINLPQSAVLGMYGILEEPVAIKGKVVIRPMMNVILTYDHRLIDDREATIFLLKIKAAVEDPRILLLDL